MILPPQALPPLRAPSPTSSRPAVASLVFLMAAAILAAGRRAVANLLLLRIASPIIDPDREDSGGAG